VQRLEPGATRPAHEARMLLALRPEKIALLAPEDEADNVVEGRIATWSYLGSGFALTVATRDLGLLRVALPAWGAPIAPAEGLPVRLGWSAAASVPVEEDG
jgi:putative spermidine/putrescine transport system ATP-binding protein